MPDRETLRIHLDGPLLHSARQRQHNFINLVTDVVESAGVAVQFHPLPARSGTGRTLTHMAPPPDDAGLVFRRVYHYPFWQIEAVAERWYWDVARAGFDPDEAHKDADRFYRFWRKRLFGTLPDDARRDGFVYIPLQGHLGRRRSFQSCTPLQMLQYCLEYEPARRLIATLHPKEVYAKADIDRLAALADRHPRLTVGMGDMESHLAACDYVVTQNSSAAFSGYFFGKPALLFAGADFHHIAVRADRDRLADCFRHVADHAPPYARYIWWFWQEQSINAGREDARDRIAARFKRFGWPM